MDPDEIPDADKMALFLKLTKEPEFQDMIHALAANNRKKGYKPITNAPYRKEKFARALQPLLDQIIETKKSKLIRYESFRNKSPSTCYNQIAQSWQWLIEDDKDQEKRALYYALKQGCEIKKGKHGIEIRVVVMPGEDIEPLSAIDLENESEDDWRAELDEFIESEETYGKKFQKDGLLLTKEEQKELEAQLSSDLLIPKITKNSVAVIKLTPEQADDT